MSIENEATHLRRAVMTRVARLYFEGKLEERIGRVPREMAPPGSAPLLCCLYKDRAMVRWRVLAVLGFRAEDQEDEPVALAVYAKEALARTKLEPPALTVIGDACDACVQINYFVTNACRGCLARPCIGNCPKDAIAVVEGQARINHDRCINCGKCQQVCPYHAIVYVPIPCIEACPTDAITQGEDKKKSIDYSKCIYCAKCMRACPFGAIMERSQLIDVLGRLASGPVTAVVAPAIVGQFKADLDRIAAGIRALGFAEVIEVALGADETAAREAREFIHRMARGDRMMTTSCCPAYFEAVAKHLPELQPFVSETQTPMHYAAAIAKKQRPDAPCVFIGPCVAKRNEALMDPLVDYVLTFEELDALFSAKDIDLATLEPVPLTMPASAVGRGFPITGGVAGAVKSLLAEGTDFRPESIESLDRKSLQRLSEYARECPANFLEVMTCAAGCVAGPAAIAGNPKTATQRVASFAKKG